METKQHHTGRLVKLLALLLVLAFADPSAGQVFFRRRGRAGAISGGGGGAGGQTQSDNFNRSNNSDLGANWTPVTSEGSFGIFSTTVAQPNTASSDSTERWSAVTWTDNQSSSVKVTVSGTSTGEGFGVAVRCASGAQTFYRLVINSDGFWELGRKSAGSFASLKTGTTTYSAGAVLKLTVTGQNTATTLVSVYNGSQIDSTTDSGGGALNTGSPGISYSSQPNSGSLDDWEGQDGL